MKKWFFINETRRSFPSIDFRGFVIFCTEEEIPEKIKEANKDQVFKLLTRKVYDLTETGEQKEIEKFSIK